MGNKGKMSFGTSTAKQAAVIRNSGTKNGYGGKKGPAAPPMNKNKGHMSGRMALLSSEGCEAILRTGSGIEVQAWKTRHYADKVQLLHPTRKDDDGNRAVSTLPAQDTLDYILNGFAHVGDGRGEAVSLDPYIHDALTVPISQFGLHGERERNREIAERNAAVVAEKEAARTQAAAEAEAQAERSSRKTAGAKS